VTGEGLDELLVKVEELLTPPSIDLDVLVPFDRGDLVSLVHREGEVLSESHEATGTRIKARVPVRHARTLQEFAVA
jgi:GTP-binding protein HflX